MRIELLILQRKESYPGELRPEIVSLVDEVTQDENPDWWPEEIEKQKRSMEDEAERWVIVSTEIPDAEIARALYPEVTLSKLTPVENE